MMISMKNNAGRKLPIPERRHQEPVTNPLSGVVGDLAIPDFLDAKKTESARASAAAIKGRLTQLAQTISGGSSTTQPTMETDMHTQTSTKTKNDASGGKAALRASARRAVAETKVPVKKIATGMTAAKAQKADAKAGKTKKVALADAITSDVSGSKPATRKASTRAKVETRTSLYDWSAAEAKAKGGTIPPAPPFASYGPHLKKCHDMAKAGQTKELREYLAGFKHDVINAGRKNLFRYGDLCLQAVKKGA